MAVIRHPPMSLHFQVVGIMDHLRKYLRKVESVLEYEFF